VRVAGGGPGGPFGPPFGAPRAPVEDVEVVEERGAPPKNAPPLSGRA
jgi:hypothetical protein